MALFVPILRLLMLFLNVYDSYKTLKDPPPSSRNAGRPSVRAMSQRKRDIKGCLAVWIVWAALSMYERSVESVVCLLIPFYDEFKSLALLFLILTRARGAEPIYLHLIRPIIKPYTRTLDGILEIMLMTGDFLFAVSTYPIHLAMEWYRQRFTTYYEVSESDQDTESSESSNCVNTSELPTSFVASSAQLGDSTMPQYPPRSSGDSSLPETPPSRRPSGDVPSRKSTREQATTEKPDKSHSKDAPARKSAKEGAPGDTKSRKASADTLRAKERKIIHNRNLEPNFFEPTRRRSGSPSRDNSRSATIPTSSEDNESPSLEPNFFKHAREPASQHQIWYPPRPSSSDEDSLDQQADLTIRQSTQDAMIAREQQQFDEWRQYPAFPSAYPPTPIALPSRLALPLPAYPAIEEEAPQQDFPPSLLPPREPLNPSPAGDLSDNHITTTPGNSPLTDNNDDADDSMSTDEYEEEDAFNITLRTPLPALGSLRSQIQPRRMVAQVSASSGVSSIPSRVSASALTTSDNGSPLRTTELSSDGSLSGPRKVNTTTSSVIGKKRAYPRTKTVTNDNRVREVEDDGSHEDSGDLSQPLASTLKSHNRKSERLAGATDTVSDTADDAPTSSSNNGDQSGDEVPPEEKRRKVVRAHPRPVNSAHPIRPRVARRATSPSSQIPKGRHLEVPVLPKKVSARSRAAFSAQRLKETDPTLSASSSASANDTVPPAIPLKAAKRSTVARKK